MGDEDVVGPVSGIGQIGWNGPGDPQGLLHLGCPQGEVGAYLAPPPFVLEAERVCGGGSLGRRCDEDPAYLQRVGDIEDQQGVLGKARDGEQQSRLGAECERVVDGLEGPAVGHLYPVEQ